MRFLAALALIFLLACGGKTRAEWKLPAALEGGWKLAALPPGRETYDLVAKLSPRKSLMGSYEGSGKVLVAAFELANGPAAFEQVQKWRAQPGKIVFYRGPWFVVIESEGMDNAQLSRMAGQIEKTMPE